MNRRTRERLAVGTYSFLALSVGLSALQDHDTSVKNEAFASVTAPGAQQQSYINYAKHENRDAEMEGIVALLSLGTAALNLYCLGIKDDTDKNSSNSSTGQTIQS